MNFLFFQYPEYGIFHDFDEWTSIVDKESLLFGQNRKIG